MVTMAQSAANCHNMHTHVDIHSHTYINIVTTVVRSTSSAITDNNEYS